MRPLAALSILCLCASVLAQSSPSYRIEEFTVNAGGHPRAGRVLSSTSWLASLVAVGPLPAPLVLRGGAYAMEVGFARSYRPPGEVRRLVALGDKRTLAWDAEGSAGTYRVYGDDLRLLPGDYGMCEASDIPLERVALDDEPPAGKARFYLVTVRNPLFEEGTKGYDSTGGARANPAPCP